MKINKLILLIMLFVVGGISLSNAQAICESCSSCEEEESSEETSSESSESEEFNVNIEEDGEMNVGDADMMGTESGEVGGEVGGEIGGEVGGEVGGEIGGEVAGEIGGEVAGIIGETAGELATEASVTIGTELLSAASEVAIPGVGEVVAIAMSFAALGMEIAKEKKMEHLVNDNITAKILRGGKYKMPLYPSLTVSVDDLNGEEGKVSYTLFIDKEIGEVQIRKYLKSIGLTDHIDKTFWNQSLNNHVAYAFSKFSSKLYSRVLKYVGDVYEDQPDIFASYEYNVPKISLSKNSSGRLSYSFDSNWSHTVDNTYKYVPTGIHHGWRSKHVTLNTKYSKKVTDEVEFWIATRNKKGFKYLEKIPDKKIAIKEMGSRIAIMIKSANININNDRDSLYIALRINTPKTLVKFTDSEGKVLDVFPENLDPDKTYPSGEAALKVDGTPFGFGYIMKGPISVTLGGIIYPKKRKVHNKYYPSTEGASPEMERTKNLLHFRIHDYVPRDKASLRDKKIASKQYENIHEFPKIYSSKAVKYGAVTVPLPDDGKMNLRIDIPNYSIGKGAVKYIELESFDNKHMIVVECYNHKINLDGKPSFSVRANYRNPSIKNTIDVKAIDIFESGNYGDNPPSNKNLSSWRRSKTKSFILPNMPFSGGELISVSMFQSGTSFPVSREFISLQYLRSNIDRGYYKFSLSSLSKATESTSVLTAASTATVATVATVVTVATEKDAASAATVTSYLNYNPAIGGGLGMYKNITDPSIWFVEEQGKTGTYSIMEKTTGKALGIKSGKLGLYKWKPYDFDLRWVIHVDKNKWTFLNVTQEVLLSVPDKSGVPLPVKKTQDKIIQYQPVTNPSAPLSVDIEIQKSVTPVSFDFKEGSAFTSEKVMDGDPVLSNSAYILSNYTDEILGENTGKEGAVNLVSKTSENALNQKNNLEYKGSLHYIIRNDKSKKTLNYKGNKQLKWDTGEQTLWMFSKKETPGVFSLVSPGGTIQSDANKNMEVTRKPSSTGHHDFIVRSNIWDSYLVGYYPFDGNAKDNSGKNHQGEGHNGLAFIKDDERGEVANFDGTDDYVSLKPANQYFSSDHSFTVGLWVKSDLSSRTNSLFGAENSTQKSGTLHLTLKRTNTKLNVNSTDTSGDKDLDPNKWHYLTFVYDKEAKKNKVYVDGVIDISSDGNGLILDNGVINIGLFGSDYFSGKIDDFKIWNKSLSNNEIFQEYKSSRVVTPPVGLVAPHDIDDKDSKNTPDLVAHFNFDGNATDSSGNSHNATIHNGVTFVDDVDRGKVAKFDGYDDYVELPNSENLSLYDHSFTVGVWINSDKPLEESTILGNNLQTERTSLLLGFKSSKPSMGFLGAETSSKRGLVQGRWHYLTFVYDKETKEQIIYLNGNLRARGKNKLSFLGRGSNLYVGKKYGGGYFSGKMDDIKIWDKRLSSYEIYRAYHKYSEGISDQLVSEYKFDGDALDSSGNNHNGTSHNGLTFVNDVQRGTVAHFDGSDDYVSLHNTKNLSLYDHSFTVGVWIKPDLLGIRPILGTKGSDDKALNFRLKDLRPYMGFISNEPIPTSSIEAIEAKKWYYLTFVYDKTTNKQMIYVNGKVKETDSGKTPLLDELVVNIGKTDALYFSGDMDDMKIWKKTLSDQDIYKEYRNSLVKDSFNKNLVAFYNFDDNTKTSSVVKDSSGKNNNGKKHGGATFVEDSERGKVLQFESKGYVTIPSPDDLSIYDHSFTVGVWAKLDFYGPSNVILGTNEAFNNVKETVSGFSAVANAALEAVQSPNNRKMLLVLENAVPKMSFSSKTSYGVSVDTALKVREWKYLTFVYDKETKEQKIYVDGVLKVTGKDKEPLLQKNMTINIGSSLGDTDYFSGRMDDMKIWKEALSSNDIDKAYKDQKPKLEIKNLALGKKATQSGTEYEGVAIRAIDGNTNGEYEKKSTTHTTNNYSQSWWQVDLGRVADITDIKIFNRTDNCCRGRLSRYHIFVSNKPFSSNKVSETKLQSGVGNYYQNESKDTRTVNINRRGRYVRIQLEDYNLALSLAEVQVFGSFVVTKSTENLALKKHTTQKNVAYGGESSRAVDSNSNGAWAISSVTHTSQSNQPWWQVDLGKLADITDVIVFNRTDDCCSSRLNNYYVLVSENPMTKESLTDIKSQSGVTAYHITENRNLSTIPVNRSGRYIRIQLESSSEYLSLAEVEVLGHFVYDTITGNTPAP